MSKPSDPLMGLKCFSIGGRMVERRERCLGMTDEERRWRAQYLKDQVLSPDEPRESPEYYRATTNFFRRLYKGPFNKFEKAMQPVLGNDLAFLMRHWIGKGIVIVGLTYLTVYYCKYHTNDFTVHRCLEHVTARKRMYPDCPGYPNFPEKTPSEFYDMGFYSSVLCQDVEIEEPPPPPPPPPPAVDPELCQLPEGAGAH